MDTKELQEQSEHVEQSIIDSEKEETVETPTLDTIYDMLKKKDDELSKVQEEVSDLKKRNAELLLRINNQMDTKKTFEETLTDLMKEMGL